MNVWGDCVVLWMERRSDGGAPVGVLEEWSRVVSASVC